MRNFLIFLLVCIFASATLASKISKKEKKEILLKELADERQRAEKLAEEVEALDEEEDDESTGEATNKSLPTNSFDDDDDEEEEEEVEEEGDGEPIPGRNPCETKKCGRGMDCVLIKNQAVCECTSKCRKQDSRHNVCSKANVTFETECELDRQFCLCSHDLEGCKDQAFKKVKLDYYGACRKLPECLPRQLEEFRVRVQEWLFRVMKDLKNRQNLANYEDWLKAAKNEKHHGHAVIWRFCQLDKKPRDTYMTRRELQFTIHSLKGMEQCIVPFLGDCDKNADRKISLKEWENCLNLEEDEVPTRCLPLMV